MTKILAISILALFLQTTCISQAVRTNKVEIKLTHAFVDSLLYQEDYGNEQIRRIANNLHLIYQFNRLKQILGHTDTVRIFRDDHSFSALYRDKEFGIDSRFIDEENLIKIWGLIGHTVDFLFSETFKEKGISQCIKVRMRELDSEDSFIKIENYTNDIISGSYKELKLNGNPIVTGNYTLVDSIYQDTIITVDYQTYEEHIEIIERQQIGIKCGEWVYYDKDGEMKIEKQKVNCKH